MTKLAGDNRRYKIGFSVVGSLLSICLFVFINATTGSLFPWFIYPAFAVFWWPLGVIFGHNSKALSLAGSLMVIILLFLTNYLTSWNTPWFLYPSFAVIWWPIAMFYGARRAKSLSVIGSLAVTVFAFMVNIITSPSYLWFYYAVFAVTFWPLIVFFRNPRFSKIFSVAAALYIIAFFTLDNLYRLPHFLWVLFTLYPVVMWPVCILLGKKARRLSIAIVLGLAGIVYYTILNAFIFPGFPWAVFPAFVLVWWPLGVGFAGRRRPFLFAICGTLLSVAFFFSLNLIVSPQTNWAFYMVFALVWWPLSVYYFVHKPRTLVTNPVKKVI